MNRYLLIAFLFLIYSGASFGQEKVDMTKKPEPLPAGDFVFPAYKEFKLDNGLKGFFVKDDEQPTFSVRLLIPGGSSFDGEKPGTSELLADMMMKGAGDRSALQIAEELDGIGGDVSVTANSDYITITASGLIKHMPKILSIFSDILAKPTFPKDEFEKLIPQKLAGLKSQKAQPSAVAAHLASMVIYGSNHPYGKFMTEKSLKEIELSDLKDYYNALIKPNSASIVFVGDLTDKEVVSTLNQYLDIWKSGKAATMEIPPSQPMPLGIYFVERPGSVQSTVFLVTNAPAQVDNDWETQSLATSVMGGGFGSRLFRTLREKYSYTYSPKAALSSKKYANMFYTVADVRNSVTDSSITVVKDLLKNLASEPASDEELGRIKKFRVGQYLMSFENPGFVAGLIQNADFQGIDMQRVKTFASRFMGYSPYEVMKITRKYMNPDMAYIVVVGNPEVKEKLAKFGKVFDYDLDLNPLTGENAKFEKVSLDPEELIAKYVDAIGGKDKLNNTKTLTVKGTATLSAQGQEFQGKLEQIFKQGGKRYEKLDLVMINSESWCDGSVAWKSGGHGDYRKLDGVDLVQAKIYATMFADTKLLQNGYKCEVLGKQAGMIVMKANQPELQESMTYFFDANTFLLNRIETLMDTPRGKIPVTRAFTAYKDIDGIKLPGRLEQTNPMFNITFDYDYKLNENVDDSIFAPSK